MENIEGKYKVALKLAQELEQSGAQTSEAIKDVLSLVEQLFSVKLAQKSYV